MTLTLLQRCIEHNVSDPAESDVLMTCVGRLDAYVAETAERNAVQKKVTGYFAS